MKTSYYKVYIPRKKKINEKSNVRGAWLDNKKIYTDHFDIKEYDYIDSARLDYLCSVYNQLAIFYTFKNKAYIYTAKTKSTEELKYKIELSFSKNTIGLIDKAYLKALLKNFGGYTIIQKRGYYSVIAYTNKKAYNIIVNIDSEYNRINKYIVNIINDNIKLLPKRCFIVIQKRGNSCITKVSKNYLIFIGLKQILRLYRDKDLGREYYNFKSFKLFLSFVILHEIGHYQADHLSKSLRGPNTSDIEQNEADAFAYSILKIDYKIKNYEFINHPVLKVSKSICQLVTVARSKYQPYSDKLLTLYHYSNDDIKYIDPSYFARNYYTERDARACNVKRSFFYTRRYPEALLKASRYCYTAKIEKSKVYDLRLDRLRLVKRCKKVGSDDINFNKLLREIKRFRYIGAIYGQVNEIVILFDKINVKKI